MVNADCYVTAPGKLGGFDSAAKHRDCGIAWCWVPITSAQGRRTMGNIFILVSAGSGAGKSTVLRILRDPLDTIQALLNEGFECIEGLLPLPGSDAPPKTRTEEIPPRFFCSEITGQALAKLLAANGETTLNATAEAGNLLDEASKPASALGQLLLKGYSGDQVEVDRISRKPVVLARPCISVCWLCQPHRIEHFLSNDRLMEDGLLARFLVVHSKAEMAFMEEEEKAIPVGVSDGYGAVINSVFEAYRRRGDDPLTVCTTNEAGAILRAYYNHNVERWKAEEGSLRCCIARWTEQAWKLTLVLHAATYGGNSHQVPVERETAERAVALQEWFVGQQVSIIRGTARQPEDNRVKSLCKLLGDTPNREMTLRNLQNSHGFSNKEVHRLVELAPSDLDLQKRQNPRGGPYSYVLVLTKTSS